MSQPSLVGRLIRSQVLLMLGCWILLVTWLCYAMTAFEHGDLDRRMKYFAQILAEAASGTERDASTLATRLQAAERAYVQGVIQTLDSASAYTAAYQVFDRQGVLIYRSEGVSDAPLALQAGLSSAPGSDGGQWRYARVESADRSVTVVVGESERGRWASILPMLQIIGMSQVLILGASLTVTWVSARRAVRPLRQLADQLGARRAGDLQPVHAPTLYSETRPIVDELNSLLAREAKRLDGERSFLADAAHELRTPLASIAADAHLLNGASNDTERKHAYIQLGEGLQRVSHLVEQLLTLARLDAADAWMVREDVDVAQLVRERLADHASRARAVSIELEAPDALVARVSRSGFTSILDNLVDNAIRYAADGGHVSVSVASDDSILELTVRDDGPGIPAHERERVFERFYRIPGGTVSGTGLGLSIVRRAGQAHDARIQFVDGLHGAGVGIQVCFPAPAPVTQRRPLADAARPSRQHRPARMNPGQTT